MRISAWTQAELWRFRVSLDQRAKPHMAHKFTLVGHPRKGQPGRFQRLDHCPKIAQAFLNMCLVAASATSRPAMPHSAFKASAGAVSRARGNGPRGRAALIAPGGTAAIVRRFAQDLAPRGGVAEWLKAHAWKACGRETVSWVRIPPPPPPSANNSSICVCPCRQTKARPSSNAQSPLSPRTQLMHKPRAHRPKETCEGRSLRGDK